MLCCITLRGVLTSNHYLFSAWLLCVWLGYALTRSSFELETRSVERESKVVDIHFTCVWQFSTQRRPLITSIHLKCSSCETWQHNFHVKQANEWRLKTQKQACSQNISVTFCALYSFGCQQMTQHLSKIYCLYFVSFGGAAGEALKSISVLK